MSKLSQNRLPEMSLNQGVEFGIHTIGDHLPQPGSGHLISAQERIANILEMAQIAEEIGADIFHVGESHQENFVSQGHLVILAAIASQTQKIKLNTAATVISTLDPVRVYEDVATIDLISQGRMELLAGSAARVGGYQLFGYSLDDYEELFREKFNLLLEINRQAKIDWQGVTRPALQGAQILPRSYDEGKGIPIWRAISGTEASANEAAKAGVPIYLQMLSGHIQRYEHLVQAYRQTLEREGYASQDFPLSVAGVLYLDSDKDNFSQSYPFIKHGYANAFDMAISQEEYQSNADLNQVVLVGQPTEIIEKILYQYEKLNFQRYTVQVDLGGVPMDQIRKTLEVLGTTIIPAVKKHTQK